MNHEKFSTTREDRRNVRFWSRNQGARRCFFKHTVKTQPATIEFISACTFCLHINGGIYKKDSIAHTLYKNIGHWGVLYFLLRCLNTSQMF